MGTIFGGRPRVSGERVCPAKGPRGSEPRQNLVEIMAEMRRMRPRLRSRTPPRAAGSADTAAASGPRPAIACRCGRPRIRASYRDWSLARTSPRRGPRNGDRRIFPHTRSPFPGHVLSPVRFDALPKSSAIMYYVYQFFGKKKRAPVAPTERPTLPFAAVPKRRRPHMRRKAEEEG